MPVAAPDRTSATLDRDAEALQTAVADLVRVYQFRDRDRICCHDISVTQCYALETLVDHGPLRIALRDRDVVATDPITQCYALETLVDHGPLRVGALAQRLFLDKSTTSRVVSTLVKKG